MSYPIITTTENQVLLVDKTRKVADKEHFIMGINTPSGVTWTVGINDNLWAIVMDINDHIGSYPILASSYPIHNSIPIFVPVWNELEMIICAYKKWRESAVEANYFSFKAGYEAAGGWTDEDLLDFIVFYKNDPELFWSEEAGLEAFKKKRTKLPTALEVETEKVCSECKTDEDKSFCAFFKDQDKCKEYEQFKTIPHPDPKLREQGFRLIPMENIKPIY